MNEKIKQLATESKLMSIIEEFDLEIINAHDVSRVEKFAELIIEECADICERFGMSGDGYTCSAEILEHFGLDYE